MSPKVVYLLFPIDVRQTREKHVWDKNIAGQIHRFQMTYQIHQINMFCLIQIIYLSHQNLKHNQLIELSSSENQQNLAKYP